MKRHRIRLRPKARRRRRFAGAVLLLAAVAVPLRNWARRAPWPAWHAPSISAPALPRAARVDAIAFPGAPESLAVRLLASIRWKPGDRWSPARPYRIKRELLEDFPCLSSVGVRRSWMDKRIDFPVSIRSPLARVEGGEGARFLDGGGAVFAAPEDLFSGEALPRVSLGGGTQGRNTAELARLITAAKVPGALPAPLARLKFDSILDGWSAELADGTRLLWGDLRWTKAKLGRLREVMADASGRFGRVTTADLRQFEDGKIFVRSR